MEENPLKIKNYRGYKFLSIVLNLDAFQKRFGVKKELMLECGKGQDYDVNVIRKVLNKIYPNHYLVRYIDTGNQYNDYFMIYTK